MMVKKNIAFSCLALLVLSVSVSLAQTAPELVPEGTTGLSGEQGGNAADQPAASSAPAVSAGRRLQAHITGRSTMVSFAPSVSGELVIEAANFNEMPAVLMVLGPDYEQLATNAVDNNLGAVLRFEAGEQTVYHLSATVLDQSVVGGELDLLIRSEGTSVTGELPPPKFTYLYGDIGK